MVEELTKRVADQMRSQQLQQLRKFFNVVMFFAPVLFMIILHDALTGAPRCQTPQQDALTLVMYVGILLADHCPSLINERSLDLWYSGMMAMLSLYVIPPICASDFFLWAPLILKMLGGAASLARMSLPAVAAWSGVQLACVCWASAGQPGGLGAHGGPSQLVQHAAWFVLLSLLAGVMEGRTVAKLRRGLEAQAMQDRLFADRALLAMYYNAVVELDSDLRIAAPSRQLAAFLLQSTTAALEQVPFQDLLLDEDDQAKFRKLVMSPPGPGAEPFVELVHVRMQDGNGTALEVELFGIHIGNPGGCRHYLIGVREPGDLEWSRTQEVQAGASPVDAALQGEAMAVLDTLTPGFGILAYTPEFRRHIMPVSKHSCLAPALVNGHHFVTWLQETVNWHLAAFSEGEERPNERPPESLLVTFKPHSADSPTCTQAICTVVFDSRDDSSDGSEPPSTLKVRFSQAVQVPVCTRGSGRASGGRGDTGSSSGLTSYQRNQTFGAVVYGNPAAV